MSTKYKENHIYKLSVTKFEEVSRDILQGAVLTAAIIIIFSTDLGSEIDNFFCISRLRSTGWSISAQEARLRLWNGLKPEGEPAKYKDVIHWGQWQESTPNYESLHTPIMGNTWLTLLPKGLGDLHSPQHQQGSCWDTMSRPLQTNEGESIEETSFKEWGLV